MKEDKIAEEIAILKKQLERLEAITKSKVDEHILELPGPIVDALEMWYDINDNKIQEFAVLCNGDDLDQDGYYCYTFFGYVSDKCTNNVAIDFQFRTKEYIPYERNYDYTLKEVVRR